MAKRPARRTLQRALTRQSPRPLYQVVKDHVRDQICEGQWKPGDRVASEHELVATLGVSRMTVNRALRELAAGGEVVRLAGVGTFVGDERPQLGLLRVANIADEVLARGHAYSCDVVLVERESAAVEVAAALGLKAGDRVYHSVCVHRENGVPIQLEDRYVNPKAAPRFASQDFRQITPAKYLLQVVPLDEVEHVVDAVTPSKEEARLLGIRSTVPCLVLTRRTWAGQDLVTWVRCLHPGPRYRLGTRFKAHASLAFA
ncbi:MAG TPA: histidine utilization repressor [Vicinamibacterales bacterium]